MRRADGSLRRPDLALHGRSPVRVERDVPPVRLGAPRPRPADAVPGGRPDRQRVQRAGEHADSRTARGGPHVPHLSPGAPPYPTWSATQRIGIALGSQRPLITNVTNVRATRPTRPVTRQQPSVGNITPEAANPVSP